MPPEIRTLPAWHSLLRTTQLAKHSRISAASGSESGTMSSAVSSWRSHSSASSCK